MRTFETGATRDSEVGKLDFEGCLDPRVLTEFARYMNKHCSLPDGSRRATDNWKKGMTQEVYMKSLLRHVVDLWLLHRGFEAARPETGIPVTIADALGGLMFNLQGYWYEELKKSSG